LDNSLCINSPGRSGFTFLWRAGAALADGSFVPLLYRREKVIEATDQL